jgi:hypothetical protein
LALESIYVESGDLSSDAGGLLLSLRKPSTLFLLTLLHVVFNPLARLSKCLQTSQGNISQAMSMARVVIENIKMIDLEEISKLATTTTQKEVAAGGKMVSDDDLMLIAQGTK